MRIAIGNQMIGKDAPLADRLALARQAGFDGVEIWLGTPDAHMGSSDDDIRRLGAAITAAGLVCSSVASTLGWQNPITSLDDAAFAQAVAVGRRQIEVARLLGADATLMVTGKVLPEAPYRQAWNRMVGGFRALAAVAQDQGVRIGAETCPKLSKNLMTPGECLLFLEAVDHPAVGIYLDTANVVYSGYAQDFIHDIGDRLVRLHAKDLSAPDAGGVTRGTWPGNGTLDWAAVAKACAAVGYDDWAVLEFSPLPGETPGLDLLRRARAGADAALNRR